MIAHVSGVLAEGSGDCRVVLTSGGVGYRVALPGHTLASLPPMGEPVAFHTCLVVREDAQELYGFETFAERRMFDILRKTPKIGPATALAMLTAYRPEELARIVAEENQAALVKISGIGAKTAQHLLLELRYRLKDFAIGAVAAPGSPPAKAGPRADVMAALANLGYAEAEYTGIVAQMFADEPDLDVGSAIRLALREIAKNKAS